MIQSERISFRVLCALLVMGVAAFPGRIDGIDKDSVPGLAGSQAVKTTLCELGAAPERFQSKIVEVRAIVQTGFQTSLLRDDTCSTFIWLSGLDTAESSPLRKDRQFQKMQEYLAKKYRPKNGAVCSSCPLYHVTATVVGRFEYVRKADPNPQAGAATGFGYLNSYESQLVLLGVSDVVAETIDRSASTTR